MSRHWVNPRYSPNAPYLRSQFVWPPRPRSELLETFAFSLEMHRTSTRLGMMLAAMSFKADAVQFAVELLAWPDSDRDESEPSVSSDDDDCDDSDEVIWGDEPQ